MSSRTSLYFTTIILSLTVFFFPRWDNTGTEATIAWDVSGYYLYLPALFVYHDIEKLEFLPEVIKKYSPTHSPEQAFPIENGNKVMKYSAGMAILYAPFFFAAHHFAKITDFSADGFSLPYQVAIQLGGLFAAIIGLVFLRKTLIRYFPDNTTAWTIILIGIGTNFFNYGTFDSANVHVWSFALLSILTYTTLVFHEKPNWKSAIGVGICVGLAALVRPTEIIFFIVPLLWGITGKKTFFQKIELFKRHAPKILAAIVITLLIGSIQLLYWKFISRSWLIYSYENQGFDFISPHFPNVFFSYRKGWLIYTPLMAFAILGLIFFIKKWKEKNSPYILSTLSFLTINIWIVASWDIWWYGGAFGQRAMIPSYVLLAFPLALMIDWLKNNIWRKRIIAPLLSACILLNLFQTYQAHWGPWEAAVMNKAYYWKIFLSTKNNSFDKLLLDTKESFKGKKTNLTTVVEYDCEELDNQPGTTSKVTRSKKTALFIDGKTLESAHVKIEKEAKHSTYEWTNICGWFYSEKREGRLWHQPMMVIHFKEKNNLVKEKFYRPDRVLKPKEWGQVCVEIKMPENNFDHYELFLRAAPKKGATMYADNLWLGLFNE